MLRHGCGFLTAEGLVAVGEELCSIIAMHLAALLSGGVPPGGLVPAKLLICNRCEIWRRQILAFIGVTGKFLQKKELGPAGGRALLVFVF